MPIHVNPPTRRSFLIGSAALCGGLVLAHRAPAEDERVSPHRFALLSDTHVPDAPHVEAHQTNMTANLRQVVREITALDVRPAGVIVNGDCAYLKGLPADYANFASCIAPLSDARLPLHVTMGNHDDRGPLYDALQSQRPERPVVDAKHVSVIEAPRANWFLLDSLVQVNATPGELGVAQRLWLDQALRARADKPALVMVHHNPQFDPPAAGQAWGGIQDTAQLMELLERHKHVKALVFGHTHNWSLARRGTLHLVNLPPVAYVFAASKPNGWVQADLRADGLHLELRTIDPNHKQQGEQIDLSWT